MRLIDRFCAWLASVFAPGALRNRPRDTVPTALPPVVFGNVSFVEKPPANEQVAPGQLYCVVNSNKPKWALFKCPCQCGGVVTLSLQPVHRPHWRLARNDTGHPTLFPSVWRDKGCLSHFWLREGRVFWCNDTGSHPDLRRPGR